MDWPNIIPDHFADSETEPQAVSGNSASDMQAKDKQGVGQRMSFCLVREHLLER